MNKREFLNTLQASLSGALPSGKVSEHMQYYEQYISDEVRKGIPESEVLESLGDPRLIAKTLMETADTGTYAEDNRYTEEGKNSQDLVKKLKSNQLFHKVLLVLLILLVLASVFTVLRFILPLVLPLVGIILILNFLKKK